MLGQVAWGLLLFFEKGLTTGGATAGRTLPQHAAISCRNRVYLLTGTCVHHPSILLHIAPGSGRNSAQTGVMYPASRPTSLRCMPFPFPCIRKSVPARSMPMPIPMPAPIPRSHPYPPETQTVFSFSVEYPFNVHISSWYSHPFQCSPHAVRVSWKCLGSTSASLS